MATQTRSIKLGDRVRVRNTMLFDDRVGEIIPTSGHPDDPWDWHVTLEPRGLDGSQRIGVMLDQIELIDDVPVQRELKPGIYRGGSPAEFGVWRLTASGVWLFCMPVAGETWKRAGDQNPGDKLIMLVDETRI